MTKAASLFFSLREVSFKAIFLMAPRYFFSFLIITGSVVRVDDRKLEADDTRIFFSLSINCVFRRWESTSTHNELLVFLWSMVLFFCLSLSVPSVPSSPSVLGRCRCLLLCCSRFPESSLRKQGILFRLTNDFSRGKYSYGKDLGNGGLYEFFTIKYTA